MIKNKILSLLKPKYTYQSFTYFIPAPKQKSSAYREKSFDHELGEFLKLNELEVVSLSSQSIACEQTQGVWVIIVCRTLKKLALTDQPISTEMVEGLYHLEEKDS